MIAMPKSLIMLLTQKRGKDYKKQEIEGKKMEGLKKQEIEEIKSIDLLSRYIKTRLKEILKPEKKYYATIGEDKYILQKMNSIVTQYQKEQKYQKQK